MDNQNQQDSKSSSQPFSADISKDGNSGKIHNNLQKNRKPKTELQRRKERERRKRRRSRRRASQQAVDSSPRVIEKTTQESKTASFSETVISEQIPVADQTSLNTEYKKQEYEFRDDSKSELDPTRESEIPLEQQSLPSQSNFTSEPITTVETEREPELESQIQDQFHSQDQFKAEPEVVSSSQQPEAGIREDYSQEKELANSPNYFDSSRHDINFNSESQPSISEKNSSNEQSQPQTFENSISIPPASNEDYSFQYNYTFQNSPSSSNENSDVPNIENQEEKDIIDNQVQEEKEISSTDEVNEAVIPPEVIENIIDEVNSKQQLEEKKSVLANFTNFTKSIFGKSFNALKQFLSRLSNLIVNLNKIKSEKIDSRLLNVFKKIALVLLMGVGLFAAYLLGASLHLGDYISKFFSPKKVEIIEVRIETSKLNEWGINTAEIFAHNRGSLDDLIFTSIKNIYFFGSLAEPVFMGQTGISAAVYYGFLKDEIAQVSQFMEYIDFLKTLQNLYEVDVYALLDRNPDRTQSLGQYLEDLRSSFEKGDNFRKAIGVQVDDLKVSYNSLNPDKERYEVDFFASMESLAAEKSDFLLKGFIDVSQKQISLRTRLNALELLTGYYNTALNKLSRRIEAVEKNKDALIEGIRVIEVPGSNLDLIIRP